MSSGSHTPTTAGLFAKHHILEKNPILLAIAILIVVAIGGIVQIVPLFYLQSTVEKVDGMRPYTPLELAGRNIYVREGCYLCHSQMIRSLRDEVERYGHYSLAAESMYDHPFQWGSKRNGPDLARVGLKYTDIVAGRAPEGSALGRAAVDHAELRVPRCDAARYARARPVHEGQPDRRRSLHRRGDRQGGRRRQGSGQSRQPDAAAFQQRYPKAQLRKFDAETTDVTEADALVAYLQMLGTLVDFKLYDDKANLR